ncbi:MAG: capsular biosynthesis protein [Xanthomonadales bacterium]|nr:Tyrosine-protein phosphatase YwqE [Xanthomonadales bacterium]MCC6594777.1 capsular biosynthesis protein [Xanthomonadales bacterium]MCE7931739.1 capsular biosynthesis protein [Xanthomonadales bacterium PRO6]
MIDLHCHLLPGIDDGAKDLDTALEMARVAVADGIHTIACTPHIYPGLYENDAAGIRRAIAALRRELDAAGIALQLCEGADVHLTPDLLAGLRADRIPCLNRTRYLLLEPPHHVAPPRLEEQVFNLQANGYVPLITHPERLTWIEDHYPMFLRMARAGAWLQITAGALVGRFGKRPRYWAQRLLDEGPVHIIASDAHSVHRRPPLLAEAEVQAAQQLGAVEASAMVRERPAAVLQNLAPDRIPAPVPRPQPASVGPFAFVRNWLRRG